jgi:iron complex outermembrane receptor protein
MNPRAKPCLLSFAIAGALAMAPAISISQESADADYELIEEVVVTGTRKEGQLPTETLSPIDVLGSGAISNQANFDLTDGLSKIAPSFNTQRFPIADGTAFIRPVTLRNLSPDHTLVLVNGARRHRSALVNLQLAPLGTTNQGSQAVDFATFPSSAIQRIEVLRDGASAQYGSDAIAGVVNLILKDDDHGGSISVQAGEYFEGDGSRTSVAVNWGFPLTSNGFLNVSGEFSEADRTSRGVARPDAAFVASIVGADQTPLNGFGQRWGDPDVDTSKLFLNAGIDINDTTAFYSHLSYSEIDVISDFFYRGPVLDPIHMTGARSTLQADADGDFLPDPAPQSLIDDILAAGLNPSNYVTADPSSPSGFVLLNPIHTLFPGGYNPNFGADLTDWAWVAGVSGETGGGLSWDIGFGLGENEVDYIISETINPSLGGLSPTSFRPGVLTQEETSINADFVKTYDVGSLASPLNVAFGLEYREETYKIGAGDIASTVAGPTAAIFGVGSDGFQGFPVESSGSFDSQSFALYADLEADITDQFSAGFAIRLEDFDEFESTEDFKLSARYEVNDRLAFRGTVNTGFRVPTPGQINTLNITTSADTAGNLIPSGVYPVAHPVALALGSTSLVPEESTSFTLGLVYSLGDNTSITVDYYDIDIEDRLALQNNTISDADIPLLAAQGVQNPELLLGSLANFFSNAFDSDVSGLDIAVVSDFEVGSGDLTVDFRYNFNEQDVTKVAAGTINASRVFDLENQVPEDRMTLTLDYDTHEMFSGYVRLNHYGSWKSTGGLFSPGDASDASSYGSETLVDLEVAFALGEHYEIAIGGENIFDTFPDAEQDGTLQFLGVVDSLTSPFGFNGGFWYVRASAHF